MTEHLRILLVEDNPADADLTCEKLEASKILNEIIHVKDGVEAMDFLLKKAPYENALRPDLVLLDLNLPRKDGREVLAEMKAIPRSKKNSGGCPDLLPGRGRYCQDLRAAGKRVCHKAR
jgi:chemotaxis family two-component system response regulator Rcp1